MGGSSGSSTQRVEPPKFQRPFMEAALQQAQDTFGGNFTPTPFPRSTVAPISGQTQAGVQELTNLGRSPFNQAVLNRAQGTARQLAGAGNPENNPTLAAGLGTAGQSTAFINDLTRRARQAGGSIDLQSDPSLIEGRAEQANPLPTLNRMQRNFRDNQVTVDPSRMTRLERSSLGVNPFDTLQGVIESRPGQNPYTDELVRRTLEANSQNFAQSVLPQLNTEADLAGGFGGSRQGVAQGIATQGLSDANARIASEILSREYQADQDRRMQALGLGANVVEGAGAQQLARTGQDRQFALGRTELEAQIRGEDLNRQLAAAQSEGQFGVQGAQLGLQRQGQDRQFAQNLQQMGIQGANLSGNLLQTGYGQAIDAMTRQLALEPQLQQMSAFGPQALLQAGDIDQRYRQAILDDEINRFNQTQAIPRQQALDFANSAGLGGMLGSTSTTPNERGGFAGAVGGAATGASLVGGLGAAGLGVSGPVGWGIIGLSALAGML